MSLPFETDLTEYAHQCALQRRHYEACQKVQQSDTTQIIADSTNLADQTVVEALTRREFVECTEPTTQDCLSDLLEMSVEPLAWNDKSPLQAASSEVRNYQGRGDRSPLAQQQVARSMRTTQPVSYGAP